MSEETRVPDDPQYAYRYRGRYGAAWEESHDRLLSASQKKTPILDLFEIGKWRNNRPTEIIFLERCLNLLKPGGRMGIVLPDGNLNNPSLSWLRRWAEGKAKLMAVVSLPEETFRSSNATVKASLVFLRKFTHDENLAWERAWREAHQELDVRFDEKRDALHADYSPRIVTGDEEKLAGLLDNLAEYSITRELPPWRQGDAPAYPRGIGPTIQGKPSWQGKVTDKAHTKVATELKRSCQDLLRSAQKRSDELFAELRGKLRTVDEAHNTALWALVRELFDYPVFVASPKTVGITSTGETGENVPNEFPKVIEAYHEFERWVNCGALKEEQPNFPAPSAA
jgi:type I restriction enzyme M protein